jgi:lipopolysaccharide export system permease protein
MTPVVILLAILIVFGLMSKNNEILALKSSGVSIYYLLRPVLLIGLIMSILLFFFCEIVVPITTRKANNIWLKEVKKKSAITSREKNIWIKGNRKIIHIKYYNPASKTIFGITLYYFDEDFRLTRRVDAQRGVFKQGKWVIIDFVEQNLEKKNDEYIITFRDKMSEQLDFLPEDLKRVIKKPEEMSFKELLTYIKKVEEEGYDATIYKVDLYAKPALSFVCVIMCLLGISIAVREERKKGIFLCITYGIVIAFFYWISYSFCLSLGYGEMLPPVIAAWSANFVFLCFGLFTLLNVE